MSDAVRNPFIDPTTVTRQTRDRAGEDHAATIDLPDGDEGDDIPAAMTESYSEIAYTQNFFGTGNADEPDGGGATDDGQHVPSGSSSSSSSQTRKRPDSLNCDKRKGLYGLRSLENFYMKK